MAAILSRPQCINLRPCSRCEQSYGNDDLALTDAKASADLLINTAGIHTAPGHRTTRTHGVHITWECVLVKRKPAFYP